MNKLFYTLPYIVGKGIKEQIKNNKEKTINNTSINDQKQQGIISSQEARNKIPENTRNSVYEFFNAYKLNGPEKKKENSSLNTNLNNNFLNNFSNKLKSNIKPFYENNDTGLNNNQLNNLEGSTNEVNNLNYNNNNSENDNTRIKAIRFPKIQKIKTEELKNNLQQTNPQRNIKSGTNLTNTTNTNTTNNNQALTPKYFNTGKKYIPTKGEQEAGDWLVMNGLVGTNEEREELKKQRKLNIENSGNEVENKYNGSNDEKKGDTQLNHNIFLNIVRSTGKSLEEIAYFGVEKSNRIGTENDKLKSKKNILINEYTKKALELQEKTLLKKQNLIGKEKFSDTELKNSLENYLNINKNLIEEVVKEDMKNSFLNNNKGKIWYFDSVGNDTFLGHAGVYGIDIDGKEYLVSFNPGGLNKDNPNTKKIFGKYGGENNNENDINTIYKDLVFGENKSYNYLNLNIDFENIDGIFEDYEKLLKSEKEYNTFRNNCADEVKAFLNGVNFFDINNAPDGLDTPYFLRIMIINQLVKNNLRKK